MVVSGLGVAAFHPEGAKFAGLASFERKGRGMSLFSVGGNAGFALGPLLTTPLVLVFGLEGTLALFVFPAAAAILIARELPRLRGLEETQAPARDATGEDDWGAFSRLGGLIALRSGVYFGLQAFVPAYFVAELSSSAAAGNAALAIMLAAGAVGTLVGGGLVDRWGARAVLVGTQLAAAAAARRAAAGRGGAGHDPARRDRVRHDRQLLGHDRDGPGLPAEPRRARVRRSRSAWRSGSAASPRPRSAWWPTPPGCPRCCGRSRCCRSRRSRSRSACPTIPPARPMSAGERLRVARTADAGHDGGT